MIIILTGSVLNNFLYVISLYIYIYIYIYIYTKHSLIDDGEISL